MNLQNNDVHSIVRRIVPTRGAAVALLAINAALFVIPVFSSWLGWVVIAYLPLLLTVVLGAVMSRRSRELAILTFVTKMAAAVTVWLAFQTSTPKHEWVGLALRGSLFALEGVGALWLLAAISGWFRFFRDPKASTDGNSVDLASP